MIIAIGCDHIVTDIKNEVRDELIKRGHEVLDVGTYDYERTHYPIYGQKVGELVSRGFADYGIVICGTGVGISLGAQKVKGTRVALVGDKDAVREAREVYDINILALGGRVSGIGAIMDMINTFLETKYNHTNDRFIDFVNSLGSSDHVDFSDYLIKWKEGYYVD